MALRNRKGWWLFLVIALTLAGCSNESPVSTAEVSEREVPAVTPSPPAIEEPLSEAAGDTDILVPGYEYEPASAAPPPARIDPDDLWESFSRGSDDGLPGDAANGGSLESGMRNEHAVVTEPDFVEEMAAAPGEDFILEEVPPLDEAASMPLPAPGVDEGPFRDEGSHHLVRVFFATDRDQTDSELAGEKFGSGRGSLTYGSCEVSIPKGHRTGELEAPRWWRLEFSEDPAKHVVLLRTDVSNPDDFFARVSERVRHSPEKNAFVFVHGYNVTFENAARRTAQITFDLGFRGAPVFYSWPSQGETGKYTVDEQNIEWSEANLKHFLTQFFDRSDAEDIYLVAHSMGNRGLTRALKALVTEKPEIRQRLREVILTAPDIDAEVFKRDIAPALTRFERPVTLYASSEDVALKASKKVHGHPRAGESGEQIVIVPGVETVDATGIDTSFFRHSYFAEAEVVLTDILDLMKHQLRADERERLEAIDTSQGRYWKFKD